MNRSLEWQDLNIKSLLALKLTYLSVENSLKADPLSLLKQLIRLQTWMKGPRMKIKDQTQNVEP